MNLELLRQYADWDIELDNNLVSLSDEKLRLALLCQEISTAAQQLKNLNTRLDNDYITLQVDKLESINIRLKAILLAR